jgi:hypothetical protein
MSDFRITQQYFIVQFAGLLMISNLQRSELHIPGPWVFAVTWKNQFAFPESKT